MPKTLENTDDFGFDTFENEPSVRHVVSIDLSTSRSPSNADEEVTSPIPSEVSELSNVELLKKNWIMLSVYILAYSTMGLGLSLVGPALGILGRQTGVSDTAKMSTIFIARAFGFLCKCGISMFLLLMLRLLPLTHLLFPYLPLTPTVGSVIGGQVVDRYGRKTGQLFTCLCLLVSAIATAAYPWATSITHLYIISFIAALVLGAIDNLLQVLLLALFKEKSPPFMQSLHAGFALGAFLAPLFIAVFLDGEDENGIAEGPYQWGFYSMGIYMALITALTLFITQIGQHPPEKIVVPETPSVDQSVDTDGVNLDDLAAAEQGRAASPRASRGGCLATLKNIWANGAKNKGIFHGTGMVLVATGSLLLWLYVGSETGYGNLISSYAVKMAYMGETDAAILASVFWGFFLLGRMSGVVLSLRLEPEALIMFDLIAAVVSVVIPAISDNVHVLWVCSGALGLAVGSLYAAMVTWLDQVVEMSGQVLSIVVVWVCLGEALFPLMMSLAMEIHPRSLLVFHAVVLSGCCGLFFYMRAYRRKHSD